MFLVWLILPWRLNPVEMGQFALISFVIELLGKVALMGMDAALLRFYVDPAERPRVLGSALAWSLVGASVAVGAFAFAWNFAPTLFATLDGRSWEFGILLLGAALGSAAANLALAHHVASGGAGAFGRLATLRSLLLGAGYLSAVWLGGGVRGLVLSQLAASVIIVAVFARQLPAELRPAGFARDNWRSLGRYGLPMLGYGLFAILSDYSGRLALQSATTLATIGVFQFYYQIATQINGVWASVNRAWTPHVFERLEHDPPQAFRHIARFSFWGTLLCAAGLAVLLLAGRAGAWHHLIAPAYLPEIDVFYVLMLGPLYCSIYTALYPAFYFHKDTVRISLVQSAISVLTIVLTFFLAARFGAAGAAIGWVLGIFLTPPIYVLMFPQLSINLRPSLITLLAWGAVGSLVSLATLRLHSEMIALACLAAAALVLLRWRRPLLEPIPNRDGSGA